MAQNRLISIRVQFSWEANLHWTGTYKQAWVLLTITKAILLQKLYANNRNIDLLAEKLNWIEI